MYIYKILNCRLGNQYQNALTPTHDQLCKESFFDLHVTTCMSQCSLQKQRGQILDLRQDFRILVCYRITT